METSNLLLIVLGVLTVLLCVARWEVVPKEGKKQNNSTEMAGSLTIGTREVQEDCFCCQENRNFYMLALADGMGEPYGGRIAARTAIQTVADLFESYNALDNPMYFFRKSFHTANKEILKVLDNGAKGTASLSSAIVYQNQLFYGVVGNVKVAVYRKGTLVELSAGHTIARLAREKFTKGTLTRAEAVELLENQRLYHYLGQDGYHDLELFDTPVRLILGDIVVLMTDGIYDLLTASEMEEVLGRNQSCQQMAYAITELVNTNPKEEKDNAGIVLLRVGGVQ